MSALEKGLLFVITALRPRVMMQIIQEMNTFLLELGWRVP